MRAVSFLASAVTLLLLVAAAATAVEGSVLAGKAKIPEHVAKKLPKAHHRSGAFIRPSELSKTPTASESSEWSTTYKMAFEMLMAFQNRNFTAAASYIDNDAMVVFSAITCGTLTKQQLIAAAQNDHAIARYFQFGHWAGYGGNSIGAIGSVGAVMGPGTGGLVNTTEMVDEVVFYFVANNDNTALMIVEQLTDLSWKQSNASSYRAVWNKLADAVNVHDRAAVSNIMTDDVEFTLWPAWTTKMETVNNKTAVVNTITGQWPEQTRWNVKTHWTIVVCDVVVSYFTWSAVNNDGSAFIMKFLMSTVVTEDLKIQYLTEFSMMPMGN